MKQASSTDLKTQTGFGNHFSTEALPGALPQVLNAPQKPPLGLYAEQLSGSAFTMPRSENLRSWLYRIRPSVVHGAFQTVDSGLLRTSPSTESTLHPDRMRWDPLPAPQKPTDFVAGLTTIVHNGHAESQSGMAAHLYAINQSMTDSFFYNSDGELLVVPSEGELTFRTELGVLTVAPGEILVIPRGIKFQVRLSGKSAHGYVCENYGAPLRLPSLGPIGSNGLANPRDFHAPVAAFEKREGSFRLLNKFGGQLWSASIGHSPLDVVAWHGNYAPYKYNLAHFNTINTVSFDHPDPSIFTVLTSPSDTPGMANIDFVIFPPRWMVAENTFRPPYYHRNPMSEFMGLIQGVYDAKSDGFVPGGSSLHNCMSAHGPDAATHEKATNADLKPERYKDTLAFMFESRYPFHSTKYALSGGLLQKNYADCWKLEPHFKG